MSKKNFQFEIVLFFIFINLTFCRIQIDLTLYSLNISAKNGFVSNQLKIIIQPIL